MGYFHLRVFFGQTLAVTYKTQRMLFAENRLDSVTVRKIRNNSSESVWGRGILPQRMFSVSCHADKTNIFALRECTHRGKSPKQSDNA